MLSSFYNSYLTLQYSPPHHGDDLRSCYLTTMEDSEIQIRPKICRDFSDISASYSIISPVGEGQGQSSVFKATCNNSGDIVAIKVTKKAKRGIEHAVRKEMQALKKVTHFGIMKFVDIKEDEQNYYTILEWLPGGSLQTIVTEGGAFSESETVLVMRTLLKALSKLHQNNVVHRDLKLANLMFSETRRRGLKIIDFGLADFIEKDVDLNKPCGTQKYMPPEMFSKRDYKTEVDMWSAGVVCFILLTGTDPFPGRGAELVSRIQQGQVQFPEGSFSKNAQNFIKKLLTKQDKRLTATQALEHPFLVKPCDRYSQHEMRGNGSYKTLRDSLKQKRCSWKNAIGCVRAALRIRPSRSIQRQPIAIKNKKPSRESRSTPRGKRYGSNDVALCNYCDTPISNPSDGLEVMDGYIHINCFKCALCNNPITDGRYVEFESLPCHRKCVELEKNNKFKCSVCTKPIGPGNYIEIENGVIAHPNCFKCFICDKKLQDGYTLNDQNKPCHLECSDAVRVSQSTRRCNKCNQLIDESEGYINTNNSSYHLSCHKAEGQSCITCKNPIEGSFIEASGDRYHKNCFVCGICNSVLTDMYSLYNGKPCHDICVKKRRNSSSSSSATSCSSCGKKLIGGVTFEGKKYHDKCFTCTHCKLPISDHPSSHRGVVYHKRCLDVQILRRGSSFKSQPPPGGGGVERAVRSPGARRVSISEVGQQTGGAIPSPPSYQPPQNPPSPVRRPKDVAVENKPRPQPSKPALSIFCHECGNKHAITEAKFCMSCGSKRV